jgi:hypothetical protein
MNPAKPQPEYLAARLAGAAYWRCNRPHEASHENLESLARVCGWRDDEIAAWLDGYYEAMERASG